MKYDSSLKTVQNSNEQKRKGEKSDLYSPLLHLYGMFLRHTVSTSSVIVR